MIRKKIEDLLVMSRIDNLKIEAKKQIVRIQEENSKCFNKKQKPANKYADLCTSNRIQFKTGQKLQPISFQFHISGKKIIGNDRYELDKNHEDPISTLSSADMMQTWQDDGSSSVAGELSE